MAIVIVRYPPKPKSALEPPEVNISRNFGENRCMGLGFGAPTNFKTQKSLEVLPWQ